MDQHNQKKKNTNVSEKDFAPPLMEYYLINQNDFMNIRTSPLIFTVKCLYKNVISLDECVGWCKRILFKDKKTSTHKPDCTPHIKGNNHISEAIKKIKNSDQLLIQLFWVIL